MYALNVTSQTMTWLKMWSGTLEPVYLFAQATFLEASRFSLDITEWPYQPSKRQRWNRVLGGSREGGSCVCRRPWKLHWDNPTTGQVTTAEAPAQV